MPGLQMCILSNEDSAENPKEQAITIWNVMSHLSAFDIIEVYLIYNRSDSRKKRNALTSACRGCGYDSPFKAVHLLLKDSHKGECVRTLIGTHFENLWILDATMFPEILDSANAMGRCNPSWKGLEIERQCIGDRGTHSSRHGLHRLLGRFLETSSTRLWHL